MVYIKGNYYHVYNRSVTGHNLFYEPDDYFHLLRLVKKYQKRYSVRMVAYCLMPNYYHFLVRQESDIPVSRFLQTLFNAYVQGLNNKMGRKGTLFEGSAKCKWIDKEEYLLQICRYIHVNPIKHNVVENLEEWEYSNYLEFIGIRNGSIFDKGFLMNVFIDHEDYRDWVENYIPRMKDVKNIRKFLIEAP